MWLLVFLFAALAILALVSYLLAWVVSAVIRFALRGRANAKQWQARGKYFVFFAIPLWVIASIYFSFHPNDDFYLQQFSTVALRAAPKSARVVAKSPSLFGLHSGESCSYSRILLSQEDYSTLFQNISTDPRFIIAYKRSEAIRDGKSVIYEQDLVPDSQMRQDVSRIAGDVPQKSSFIRPNTEHRQYGLIFLSDKKHIEVHSCL